MAGIRLWTVEPGGLRGQTPQLAVSWPLIRPGTGQTRACFDVDVRYDGSRPELGDAHLGATQVPGRLLQIRHHCCLRWLPQIPWPMIDKHRIQDPDIVFFFNMILHFMTSCLYYWMLVFVSLMFEGVSFHQRLFFWTSMTHRMAKGISLCTLETEALYLATCH